MTLPEKKVENKLKLFLKNNNIWYVKYYGGGIYSKVGTPDILACINGKFVAFETKSMDGKLSQIQIYQIDEIKKSGGTVFVVNPSNIERIIESLKHGI